MKVVITGAGGQVASELAKLAKPGVETVFLNRSDLDITDEQAVRRAMDRLQPDAVINTAAYTAVDKAESEPDAALKANAHGPGYLAAALRARRARLIHISTDFVFDGQQSHPYLPTDITAPLGVYGQTKLAGELRVREELPDSSLILRTAWVYAAKGHNFVRTMLRLMRERDEVRVVEDQIGTPTWAASLAELIWIAITRPEVNGIHHWTDAGAASWFDFAVAIQEEALSNGLLDKSVPVHPIATSEYPTPARRPAFSMLNRRSSEELFGLESSHWRVNLRKMLLELHNG